MAKLVVVRGQIQGNLVRRKSKWWWEHADRVVAYHRTASLKLIRQQIAGQVGVPISEVELVNPR